MSLYMIRHILAPKPPVCGYYDTSRILSLGINQLIKKLELMDLVGNLGRTDSHPRRVNPYEY